MKNLPYQFVDANIIMYCLGSSHPLREPCRSLLDEMKKGQRVAVTNTEVLQEILHRYFSLRKTAIGEIAYRALTRLCRTILPVTIRDTDLALGLLKAHPQITTRDAVHAATMLNNGIREIISTDTHFDQIGEIYRIAPEALSRR